RLQNRWQPNTLPYPIKVFVNLFPWPAEFVQTLRIEQVKIGQAHYRKRIIPDGIRSASPEGILVIDQFFRPVTRNGNPVDCYSLLWLPQLGTYGPLIIVIEPSLSVPKPSIKRQ